MELLAMFILAVAGAGAGYGASTTLQKRKAGAAADQAQKELDKAKREASKIVTAAREDAAGSGRTRGRVFRRRPARQRG